MLMFSRATVVWGTLVLVLGCQPWDREPREWTTRSPQALESFRGGFDDLSKAYYADARVKFQRALELDPEFVAAQLFLATHFSGHGEGARLLASLQQADLSRVTPRERFLVRYELASQGLLGEDPEVILQEYAGDFPEDPFAIRAECDLRWEAQEWETSESCYRKLLRLHPNWVMAQNRLGLLAMARGRFDDAYEHFLTYRYIAPDQANPYQSMGELLALLGRYEESEEALLQALAIKDDFCEAYRVRVKLRGFQGKWQEAERLLLDMREIPACQIYEEWGFYCTMEAWNRYQAGDLEGAWKRLEGECLERRRGFDLLAHRMAVMTGRIDEARAIEEALAAYAEEISSLALPIYHDFYRAVLDHMRGLELLSKGEYTAAADHFAAADRRLGYWGGERASFKIFNRLNWLRALESAGEIDEARQVRENIALVNPRIVDEFPLPDLDR